MSEDQASPHTSPAALAGSMAAFPLVDVLDLLSRLGSTGELQVVGRGVDRHLWVDSGDLCEPAETTATGILFELACAESGWFSFTPSAGVPEGTVRVPLPPLIVDVAAQLAEWRALVRVLPFEAVVRMAQSTPSDEIQIRSEQWRILSFVGPGRAVFEVLSSSPLTAIDTLRTLGELVDAQLLSVEYPADHAYEAPAAEVPVVQPEPEPEPEPEPVPQATDSAPPPSEPPAPKPAARATRQRPAPAEPQPGIMPPPITGDPWSTPTQVADSQHQPAS